MPSIAICQVGGQLPSRKKSKSVPTSVLGRVGKLFATGVSLVGQEVAARVGEAINNLADEDKLKTRLNQASQLVESLSQLKGAAMKAGQILSLEFSDLLPPEITSILRKLHDESAAMDFPTVQKILRKELGPERFAKLEKISEEPVASASIGQVHTAMLDGRMVAIKIQFPGVDKSIGVDLGLVKQAMQSVLWFQKRSISLDALFAEFDRVLKQEVDYRKEAKFLEKFAEFTREETKYCVPEVNMQYSTKRVLTLSFEEGIRLKDWLQSSISELDRSQFADLVLELLFREFFEWGLVQTDPNYGNFLFRPDRFQLVLLDFGATNSYSLKIRKDVRRLLEYSLNHDETRLLDLAYSMKILDEREPAAVRDEFVAMMQLIVRIFRPEAQPFMFSDSGYLKEIREATLNFANHVKYTAPAQQLIFLNRKLGGMFHLLKDLRASADLSVFWERVRKLEL
jgi:aarF domain-containing kinase